MKYKALGILLLYILLSTVCLLSIALYIIATTVWYQLSALVSALGLLAVKFHLLRHPDRKNGF
jgi:hypothetical protein